METDVMRKSPLTHGDQSPSGVHLATVSMINQAHPHPHLPHTRFMICRKNQSFLFLFFSPEKVKDLFPEGSLNSSTKLVLINTVYFKGLWNREFKKENTKEEDFWLNKVCFFIYVCLYLACVV